MTLPNNLEGYIDVPLQAILIAVSHLNLKEEYDVVIEEKPKSFVVKLVVSKTDSILRVKVLKKSFVSSQLPQKILERLKDFETL